MLLENNDPGKVDLSVVLRIAEMWLKECQTKHLLYAANVIYSFKLHKKDF